MAEVTQQVSSARKGLAPAIRRLKLKYPEMSHSDIAARVGCSPPNVTKVLQRFLADNLSDSELREYQENKADIYDALQARALVSITNEKLENASVRDLAVAAGIWEDKARVIRGQATGINVSVLLDVVDAIRSKPPQVIDSQAIRSASADDSQV